MMYTVKVYICKDTVIANAVLYMHSNCCIAVAADNCLQLYALFIVGD
jgi:hypothetical protein